MNWTAHRLEMILDLAFRTKCAVFLLQFAIAATVDISWCFTFFFFFSSHEVIENFQHISPSVLIHIGAYRDWILPLRYMGFRYILWGFAWQLTPQTRATLLCSYSLIFNYKVCHPLSVCGTPIGLKTPPKVSRESHSYGLQPFPQNSTGDTVYIWKMERLKTYFQLASV